MVAGWYCSTLAESHLATVAGLSSMLIGSIESKGERRHHRQHIGGGIKSHIKLGAVGALRDYMLVDVRQYLEALANQMAAQIGGGAGDYNDLQAWGAWVMDDKAPGPAKKTLRRAALSYATIDTRFPNQQRLPRHLAIEMADAGFVG